MATTKRIYVKEEDLEIFKKAQKLMPDRSLSSIIAEALQHYITVLEAEEREENLIAVVNLNDNSIEIFLKEHEPDPIGIVKFDKIIVVQPED